jgi:hypothetical protein
VYWLRQPSLRILSTSLSLIPCLSLSVLLCLPSFFFCDPNWLNTSFVSLLLTLLPLFCGWLLSFFILFLRTSSFHLPVVIPYSSFRVSWFLSFILFLFLPSFLIFPIIIITYPAFFDLFLCYFSYFFISFSFPLFPFSVIRFFLHDAVGCWNVVRNALGYRQILWHVCSAGYRNTMLQDLQIIWKYALVPPWNRALCLGIC